MDRRDFLKSLLAAGAAVGVAGRIPWGQAAARAAEDDGAAADAAGADDGAPPDMVAVRNGEPDAMFDAGIEAMGGMGRFVQPGQTVVIKPNFSFGRAEEFATDTNPRLIARIIRRCQDAGAAKVIVLDHILRGTEQSCLEGTGLGGVIQEAGATHVLSDADRYYRPVEVAGASMKDALVHEAVLDCDVFINAPVLKHHGGAGMSCAMKNLMGVVWDRGFWHRNDLNQCVADFLHVRKPDLNVVDAYRILLRNGPGGGNLEDVQEAKMQILSTDIVAADAAASRVLGRQPADFPYIGLAQAAGFGEADAAKLRTRSITV